MRVVRVGLLGGSCVSPHTASLPWGRRGQVATDYYKGALMEFLQHIWFIKYLRKQLFGRSIFPLPKNNWVLMPNNIWYC